MQINKILSCILILFIICGCTGSSSDKEEDSHESTNDDLINSPYIEPIPKLDYVHYFSKDTTKYLKNYFGDPTEAFIGESINLIGKEIDFYDLKGTDLYGNEVDFSKYKDKKVLVEIAATYCTHCGEQLKFMSRVKKNLGDIEIIQRLLRWEMKDLRIVLTA